MISKETPYKLAEIIRDTWPNIFRPQKQSKYKSNAVDSEKGDCYNK